MVSRCYNHQGIDLKRVFLQIYRSERSCVLLGARGRRPARKRHRVHGPVEFLLALALPMAATAAAQEVPGDRDSLSQRGTRTFDLGADVRKIREYAEPEGFIPVNRVTWIYDLTNDDPLLDATVIHIKSFEHPPGSPAWSRDLSRDQFAPAEDLAAACGLQGYDVRWWHEVAPTNRGDIILFPKRPGTGFFVHCVYDRTDPIPTDCQVSALYPTDPQLRIMVRMYRVTDPLNDFTAIAERALSLVFCLDVTDGLASGAWRPIEPDGIETLSEFLGTCKDVQS